MMLPPKGAKMEDISSVEMKGVIDALAEGVYVCDLERRITYWNKSAERITGWTAGDVIGTSCFDGILCHVDKDGHQLCGEECCPLHRAMVTGTGTRGELLVYAQGKNGQRVPTLVSVAPIRNAEGQVIGGVETFRDASGIVHDLEHAKAIQQLALQHDTPEDSRLTFSTHYIPRDIIGGDYYAISRLDDHRYGLMLADIVGHGVAAALYTMHLSQLWDRFGDLMLHPAEFAGRMNKELVKVLGSDSSFATAVCGLIDLEERVFRFAGAGGPQMLLTHSDGAHERLESSGLPFGLMDDASYDEAGAGLRQGDSLLIFSDGAVEVMDAAHKLLGVDGLMTTLRKQGYPQTSIRMDALEKELLKYSNAIRLGDDLTIIEIRFGGL
ncbi:MAG: PP2C family protein-serine/threonine phosphatase [Planctomycetota bacterium]|jgi:PAS domain S-box-containing protein